jgi:hypothetical protein
METPTMDEALDRASILAGKARVPQHAVYRKFVQETVVLNLATGKYHGLNPTAGRMLETLEVAPTVAAAAELLAEEYARPADELEQDLCELCVDLQARGLLEIVDDGSPSV